MYEFWSIFWIIWIGCGVSALILAAEHITLWEQRNTLSLTGRYRLGTAALSISEIVTLLLLAHWGVLVWWSATAAIVGPVLSGGLTVEGLHYWRRTRGQSPWPETLFEAGFAAGVAKGRAEARGNGSPRKR